MSLLGRELTTEERDKLEHLARSRTEEIRLVERARIILGASEATRLLALGRSLGKDKHTVQFWIQRFLKEGIDGLHDRPRPGCPCQYSAEQKARVLATALTSPQQLGLPFGSWTHDRLTLYVNQELGIPMSRSRIATLLHNEGLRWHHQEGWFGERVDPAFAEKRGPSSRVTRLQPSRL